MSTNEQTLKELYETKQKAEAAIAALEAQRTPSPGLPSVLEISEFFGAAARTSDDGSIQQNVLCAKVPSLVRDLLNATNQNP